MSSRYISVMVSLFQLNFRFEHLDFVKAHSLLLEILIVFQWYISGIEVVIGRSAILLERTVFFTLLLSLGCHSFEVEVREDSVVRDHMVSSSRLKIM